MKYLLHLASQTCSFLVLPLPTASPPQIPRLVSSHLPSTTCDSAWGSALPHSLGEIVLSLGFKYRQSTDAPQIYIQGPNVSPELQTQISEHLMDTFPWINMPQMKLLVITPESACPATFLVAMHRTLCFSQARNLGVIRESSLALT